MGVQVSPLAPRSRGRRPEPRTGARAADHAGIACLPRRTGRRSPLLERNGNAGNGRGCQQRKKSSAHRNPAGGRGQGAGQCLRHPEEDRQGEGVSARQDPAVGPGGPVQEGRRCRRDLPPDPGVPWGRTEANRPRRGRKARHRSAGARGPGALPLRCRGGGQAADRGGRVQGVRPEKDRLPRRGPAGRRPDRPAAQERGGAAARRSPAPRPGGRFGAHRLRGLQGRAAVRTDPEDRKLYPADRQRADIPGDRRRHRRHVGGGIQADHRRLRGQSLQQAPGRRGDHLCRHPEGRARGGPAGRRRRLRPAGQQE